MRPAPVPPLALDALLAYLNGRAAGPLFTTDSGWRWTQPEVWKHLRVLARQAALPASRQHQTAHPAAPIHHDNLANGVALQDVQDAVSHSDPRTTQRYNRRRRQLDNHPAYALASRLAERLQPEGDIK
jgi:site-specific recombinase XerD